MNSNVWLDGMMGLIAGDALGVPVQFLDKDEITKREAGLVKGMEAGGIFDMPAGTWSDDGSMALATLDSIVNNKRIDLKDIMECFCRWELEGKEKPLTKEIPAQKQSITIYRIEMLIYVDVQARVPMEMVL